MGDLLDDNPNIWFCGIDPGKDGAIALLNPKLGEHHIFNMPLKGKKVNMREFLDIVSKAEYALIEKQYIPFASANMQFGAAARMTSYGKLLGALELADISTIEIGSSSWKKMLNLKGGKEGKKLSVSLAKELFPDCNLRATERARADKHDRAEALLLAHLAATEWLEL